MKFGEVKSSYESDGLLAVHNSSNPADDFIALTNSSGAYTFTFYIDPGEIDKLIDLLQAAKRTHAERLAKGAE